LEGGGNLNVENPKGGCQKPFVIIQGIPNHINGHSIKPNMVALKYPTFKKDIDLDAHVKVFNSIVKAIAKTSEEYIINLFCYMLRGITLNWCHNYMLKCPNYIFLKLTHAFCNLH
jgi:hypothetical protein